MVILMFDEINCCYSTGEAYRGMPFRRFGNVVSGL